MTITAHSTPDYDEFGPDSQWSCEDWVTWHRLMIDEFGEPEATRRWVEAWRKGLSVAGGGEGTAPGAGYVFDSVPLSCRDGNEPFKRYIRQYSQLWDVVHSGVGGAAGAVVGGAVTGAKGGGKAAGEVGDAIGDNPKTAIALGLGAAALGLGIGAGAWWYASKR